MSRTETDPENTTVATSQDQPRARRSLVPIVLAVLAVASAVVVGLLGWQAIQHGNTERTAASALDAARTKAPQVLSFDVKTLDADLARGRAQLSGTFVAQFDRLATQVIAPASKENGLTSKVEVVRSALIDSKPDRAEALLFLSQATNSTAQPEPQKGTIQVKVVVTKAADGQWLISDMVPL